MRVRHPLGLVAGGLVLVVLDFRTESLDLLLDPVGWSLVVLGGAALGLRRAAVFAALAGVLSLADAYHPYRYRLIRALTGDPVDHCPPRELCQERVVFDPATGWRFAALAASVLAGVAAVLLLLVGLRRRAIVDGDQPAAGRLRLIAWSTGLTWGLAPAVGMVAALVADPIAYDPVWNGPAEYAALLGWAAMTWLVIELCFWMRRGWALPGGTELSPWTELATPDEPPPGY
jgi:hypothetical protein